MLQRMEMQFIIVSQEKKQSRKRKLEEDEKFHLNIQSSSSLEDIYKFNWATGLYNMELTKLELEICVVASDVTHLMVITITRRKHENQKRGEGEKSKLLCSKLHIYL